MTQKIDNRPPAQPPSPDTVVYDPGKDSTQIYGFHIPYNQGYDAQSQRNFNNAEQVAPSGWFIRPNRTFVALWITDITADFSLSGQTGQSRMQRQFYPRSFNDVALHITGQTSNVYEYNRLALFVRGHQWEALDAINQGSSNVDQTVTFILNDNTPSHWRNPRGRVKGRHQNWQVQGYIKTIAAGAVAHNVAPQFEMDFIVVDTSSHGNTAIWQETLTSASTLNTFVDMVNLDAFYHKDFTGYVPLPQAAPPSKTQTTAAQGLQQAETWSVPVANFFSGF